MRAAELEVTLLTKDDREHLQMSLLFSHKMWLCVCKLIEMQPFGFGRMQPGGNQVIACTVVTICFNTSLVRGTYLI